MTSPDPPSASAAGRSQTGSCGAILGIESSCDETAAAVVTDGRVLSSVVASQHELHAQYRGVVPEIASRAHAERIEPIIAEALGQAGVGPWQLAAVAVASRPGLIGSLLVGVSAAKAIAWATGARFLPVDHLRAHLAATELAPVGLPPPPPPALPALGLVVSGGHTSMSIIDAPGAPLRTIGSTRDDAAGEAYDKLAAILGLPYPGGPVVDRLAAAGDPARFELPLARLGPGSLDFSFSGLKTAALYLRRGLAQAGPLDHQTLCDLCAGFQRAAVGALLLKLGRALDQHPACVSVLIGGGVACNSALRAGAADLARNRGLALRIPPPEFCLDNAAMIAAAGAHALHAPATADDLAASASPTAPRAG
ncbi:MAG: tRNA (adenosine(37)-N6)-threonylcarbamoyltransferase complex transferase subunit TsaD [Planctomyces sp.]|nr:tRNA (adenosine(37)-N6)-threonylcarbamoyltransferase complex transferase subunit TsaD [Planctomyces sp.]MBA4039969.1 tRNA (adenosine(37)-N6)-threonylcarbamoyltransferase complex transferase subunit TsaD [Planctomyces sp.]MBA4119797.1 tRNA (adenosine(37)-N6)-threonylcarbamoyltransferase complex transferase subunit TsaD [Isosphaera sp.]